MVGFAPEAGGQLRRLRREGGHALAADIAARGQCTRRHGAANARHEPGAVRAQPVFLNTLSVLKVATSSTGAVFAQSAMIGSAVA